MTTPEQKTSIERRDNAIAEAERIYRRALETYNDEVREASRVYDRAVAAAQEQWRAEIAADKTQDVGLYV